MINEKIIYIVYIWYNSICIWKSAITQRQRESCLQLFWSHFKTNWSWEFSGKSSGAGDTPHPPPCFNVISFQWAWSSSASTVKHQSKRHISAGQQELRLPSLLLDRTQRGSPVLADVVLRKVWDSRASAAEQHLFRDQLILTNPLACRLADQTSPYP